MHLAMTKACRCGPIFGCLLGAVVALGAATDARACACCTEPGQRLEASAAMRDYERAELERVSFSPTSQLFTTAAFPDGIKGIANPSDKPYGLRTNVADGRIVFDLTDPQGKSGRITLPVPRRLTRFEVDPRGDKADDRGQGPTLYKEWRLEAEVRLGGILAAGGSRAQAKLILHGRGNSCTGADDFKGWTLSVDGPGIRFTLLGDLATSAPASK